MYKPKKPIARMEIDLMVAAVKRRWECWGREDVLRYGLWRRDESRLYNHPLLAIS
jgi:hypothetical protein